MTRALLVSLYALRAQVDSVVAQVEDAMGIQQGGVEPGSCPQCKAGEEKQEDASTFGVPMKRCLVCRTEYESQVLVGDAG